jgi:hypothetical protein
MKKFIFIISAMAGVMAFSSPVAAQIEEKNVIKGKFQFSNETGYIYLTGTSRQFGLFLKTPNAADVEAYTADWEKAFLKAQQKHTKLLSRWESDVKLAAQTKSKVPEKPVEPTRENFSIGDIETRHSVSFGPNYVFSKDKVNSNYAYMIPVSPGTYTYHGPLMFDPNAGYIGTCYCMGSIQFEVKAGVVTDIGNFLVAAPFANKDMGDKKPVAKKDNLFVRTLNAADVSTEVKFGLPETLSKYPSVVADFRAAAKADNFFSAMVSRMPPIPGILGYQRDKVVDFKATISSGEPIAPNQVSASTTQ